MSYKVALQQQLKPSLQQIPLIHPPSRPRQPQTSQHLTSYRNFLRNAEYIPKQELITQLEKHSFVYSEQTFEETFKIQVKSFLYNLEIFQVAITYASFTGLLQVINIDRESPLHSTCDSASGGYGKIYKLTSQGRTYATKCITYSEVNFQQNFSNAVIECFLLKIASALEVGPCMQQPLGFDIVIYRNCLEFSMEFCEYKQGQYLQNELKTALQKLHTMRIIHYDIKPQNINYSQIFERYIFIDFGLSKIIEQDVGQKTWSSFRGSLVYCNSQMEAAYIDSQVKLIDLYYNDAQCLKKSLTNLQQRLQFCEIQKNPNEEISDMTEIYQITKLKWRIYTVSRQNSCLYNIESIMKDPLINKHIASVNQFLNNLPEGVQLFARFRDRLWSVTDRQQRIPRNFITPKLKQLDLFNDSESDIFRQRFKQINTLNFQNLTFKCVDSSDWQEKILQQIESSMFSSKQIYYLKVLDVLRVQDNNYPMNLKQKVAKEFVMNEIKPALKEEFAIKTSLLFMLQHFFNSTHNKYSCILLYNLLCSLFFYEVIQEVDAVRILKQFMYLEMDLSTKIKLAFRFLISIRWIQGKYQSIYDYERLQSDYWMAIKAFLQSLSAKGMSHPQRLYYSILSNIIQQPLSKTYHVQIDFIIGKHKFENLMTLDKKFLKDLYLYIIQRDFQHTSQNRGYIFDSTLQRYLKLASDYSKKCQISMCLFSRVHLFNFNYRRTKLIQSYLYDIDTIACNYPQLKYYTFYVCYQLHRFNIGRYYEENIIQLMQNITKSSKYIKKLQIFSELLKIYTFKKRQNEYEDFYMSGHTLKFALKTISQLMNAIKTYEFPSYLRHKHHIIRLAQCLLVNFNFIIQFKLLQRPVIGNMITNVVQDFVNLVDHSECIACKYKSLMLIANLWANRQLIFNTIQNALKIIVSHIAQNIKMNQHILDNISTFINFQCDNIQTNSKNLIMMFYEFINLSKCYDYFFEKEWVGEQRLTEVYQYLFESQMHEQLIQIIEVIINYIHCNSSRHHFKILFRSIYNIIECMPNKQAEQQFYNNHTYIFAHFKQKRFNPFIIFYLFIVSLSNHQKGRDNYLFYLIAKSINFYSYQCSQLVQSFYYPRFINHMNYSHRKRHFLTKKTYHRSIIENKLSFAQFSHDFKKRKTYSYRSQAWKALDSTLKKYFMCIFPHKQPRIKSKRSL